MSHFKSYIYSLAGEASILFAKHDIVPDSIIKIHHKTMMYSRSKQTYTPEVT